MNPWRTEDRADGAREFHRRASAELRQLKLSARDADAVQHAINRVADEMGVILIVDAGERARWTGRTNEVRR